MNKFKKAFSLSLTTLLLASGTPLMANAETTDAGGNKTSDATVDIDASDGALTLDAVPNFDFGTASAKDLLTGATLDLTTTASTNNLQITDTRGNGNQAWTITADLTKPFTSTDSTTLANATLKLASEAGTTDSVQDYTQTDSATLSGNGAQPVVEKASAFAGTSRYAFTSTSASGHAAAQLILPATPKFKAGTYTGEVTWTLASVQ